MQFNTERLMTDDTVVYSSSSCATWSVGLLGQGSDLRAVDWSSYIQWQTRVQNRAPRDVVGKKRFRCIGASLSASRLLVTCLVAESSVQRSTFCWRKLSQGL